MHSRWVAQSPPPTAAAAAAGLFGLTPIIADLRGFFTRYNWISDTLQILTAPVENFINTNYYPLPQVL